jgi:hypothetical protein
MTEPTPWTVRPLSVHVPPGERRTPVAMVRIAIGPLEVVLAVSRLRKSGPAVRPPMAEGGSPATSRPSTPRSRRGAPSPNASA